MKILIRVKEQKAFNNGYNYINCYRYLEEEVKDTMDYCDIYFMVKQKYPHLKCATIIK